MHDIKITRPTKVLFPKDGITKAGLIDYYRRIAPRMIPHLAGRPLALQRFPDGISQPGFFQKSAAPYYPAWIRKVTVPKAGGTVQHVICDDADTLVYLANQACITLHPWLSRADHLHRPDEMIFDLDPSTQTFTAVIDGAHMLKEILESLELPAYLKATGSRGLHIVVPLDASQDFEAVRNFARTVASLLTERDPTRFTLEVHKAKRGRRVFVDINRNAYAQTAVAPYSVRPRDGAPIAIPLAWSELRKRNFRPDAITIRNVFDHPSDDPWEDFRRRAVSLDGALRHLEQLNAA
jgi:bifunctional non-homologous end joining protein LigD